jgi:hypothetical protein
VYEIAFFIVRGVFYECVLVTLPADSGTLLAECVEPFLLRRLYNQWIDWDGSDLCQLLSL